MLRRYTLLKVNIREQLPRPYIRAPHSCLPQIAQTTNHIRNSLSGHFFSSLLSCSLSRGSAQFFTPPLRTAPIVGAHSKRQDPKTPVEQALMRGLGTA